MAEAVFFYLFATLLIVFALAVIHCRLPIYSVLSLLVVMFCVAALFVMLGAYFLAAIQILLYAGAVVVLFLFVMMLLNFQPDLKSHKRLGLPIAGSVAAATLLFLFTRIYDVSPSTFVRFRDLPALDGSVQNLGRLLFHHYLLPFELVSFIILIAILGAVSLVKHEKTRR